MHAPFAALHTRKRSVLITGAALDARVFAYVPTPPSVFPVLFSNSSDEVLFHTQVINVLLAFHSGTTP